MYQRLALFYVTILSGLTELPNVMTQGNIARGKPTNQTGAWSGTVLSSRAVDGLYRWPNCSITDKPDGQPGEWWVDLEDSYRVTGVKLYNTPDGNGGARRLTDVVVSVGPSLSGLKECGRYPGQVPQSTRPATISCVIVGRFVHITRFGGREINRLLLCEVEVEGGKPYDCSRCPLGDGSEPNCSGERGCVQCGPGGLGPECEPCPTGRYGLNCANQCGRCVQEQHCNPQDGVCSQGCQIWWAGDTCHTEIIIPNWTSESASIGDFSNTTIQVTWQQIMSLPQTALSFYGYIVRHTTSNETHGNLNVTQTTGMDNTAVLDKLIPHTTYDITIVPYRQHSVNITAGTSYQDLTARTACGFPDSPSDVQVGQNDSSILVSWKKIGESEIQFRCQSLTALRVDHRMSGVIPWTMTGVNMLDTEHVIPISEPGTYDVRVILVNSANLESLSDVNSVTVRDIDNEKPGEQTGSNGNGLAGSGENTGVDDVVVISVTVVAVVVVISVTVIVTTLLVLRHRRTQAAQNNPTGSVGAAVGKEMPTYVNKSAVEKERRTYVNETVVDTCSPAVQDTGTGEYEEVPGPAVHISPEVQYEGMDMRGRDHRPSADTYTSLQTGTRH